MGEIFRVYGQVGKAAAVAMRRKALQQEILVQQLILQEYAFDAVAQLIEKGTKQEELCFGVTVGHGNGESRGGRRHLFSAHVVLVSVRIPVCVPVHAVTSLCISAYVKRKILLIHPERLDKRFFTCILRYISN